MCDSKPFEQVDRSDWSCAALATPINSLHVHVGTTSGRLTFSRPKNSNMLEFFDRADRIVGYGIGSSKYENSWRAHISDCKPTTSNAESVGKRLGIGRESAICAFKEISALALHGAAPTLFMLILHQGCSAPYGVGFSYLPSRLS